MGFRMEIQRDDATPKLRMMAERYPEAHRKALFAAGSVVERAAKGNVSGRRLRARTSRLRGSIRTVVHGDEAIVGSNVVYARIHEVGGIIRPVRAQSLRFQTDDGTWHTVKRVVIPARFWLSAALGESWSKIRGVFESALAKLIG